MSDPNIRLLLHRIWGTWKRSGYEKDRPQSFIFMPHLNPVQEAVLARWGIKLLTADNAERPDDALVDFLADLKARIHRGKAATVISHPGRSKAAKSKPEMPSSAVEAGNPNANRYKTGYD